MPDPVLDKWWERIGWAAPRLLGCAVVVVAGAITLGLWYLVIKIIS